MTDFQKLYCSGILKARGERQSRLDGWSKKNDQQIPNRGRCSGQRIVVGQNIFGMKDSYCIVDKSSIKILLLLLLLFSLRI